jgi:hypothetical protein
MIKKGIVIASAVAAAMLLAGCSQQPQPMPDNQAMSQSGPNGKLGASCKGHHCKGHHCKGHHCSTNHCNSYNN